MKVDGKAIAEDIYGELAARAPRSAKLGILVAERDPSLESFVAIKTKAAKRLGVELVRVDLDADAGTERAILAIRDLAQHTDGVIVQLPLSKSIDANAALSAVPDDKDVDAISTGTGYHLLAAPVALAVVEILKRNGIEPRGKRAAIVGNGRLVGAPTAALLKTLGASISIVTLEKGSLEDLKEADIVVCGAGSPGFIKPEQLKKGVVLIDAGTSEQGGRVVGDCDPACEGIASVFTPVPGGVGPIAVAMIFKNLFDLIERQ